jgi:replicative DNA helicase
MTDAPHSEAAEQSVVGQMLANPACIGDVTGTLLDGSHFFLSAHRVLYDAIVESFYADDPTDPLTIAETCGPRLAKLWGLDEKLAVAKVQSYANGHTLAADPVDHARVVKRHADLRALLGVAATIEREVAAEQHPPEQIAGIVSSEAMKIATGTLTAHEVVSFGDAGRRFIQAMRERVALKQAGVEPGVKFNIAAIDGFTKGVQPTELVIGGGESGVGKALALDTPLPTPTGWTTQGDAEPGTLLFDEAGEVCVVRAVSEIWNGRPCFRVRSPRRPGAWRAASVSRGGATSLPRPGGSSDPALHTRRMARRWHVRVWGDHLREARPRDSWRDCQGRISDSLHQQRWPTSHDR